jgi:hypothetical protein
MLKRVSRFFLPALALGLVCCQYAHAQIAYGVNAAGTLFTFDTDAPATVTTIGPVNVGGTTIFMDAIDFRPGTSTLYAIDVGANTTQLYTINIGTGAATPVGAGFPSSGAGYSLSPNDSIGFDFNPTTLQVDGSMRIRLVATNNTNLRLNSSTGLIAGTDTALAFASGSSPFVDGAAYINNVVGATATTLFDMDSRNDDLLKQDPPNAGTVATVGSFGVTIDASRGIGFDIFTTLGSTDNTIGGDFGFAVLKRPDAPLGGPLGAYLLYDVNLATGAITNGALVGPAATPFDFEGGFAVLPVPEPATVLLALVGATGLWVRRR